ncbi:MAG: FAD-dependent oxidoreductase, partial [Clostridia bacterium]|nr:FAD-dependent oxidoreductase [Clostridia bacterium]
MSYDADVLIIGGGASGLIAACALARRGRRVVLLEKQDRVGRKLLSTGNGRCNLTNLRAEAGDYHGAVAAARAALRAWPPQRVMALFD